MGDAKFSGWAVLEAMGHRSIPGFVDEVEVASAKFLRVRVPAVVRAEDGKAKLDLAQVQLEQLYRPESLYCLTPTTEWAVLRAIEREFRYTGLPALPPPGSQEPAREDPEDFDEDSSTGGRDDGAGDAEVTAEGGIAL